MSVHLRSLIGTIADERATIQRQTGERGRGQPAPASGSPVNPPQGGMGSAAVIARNHYIVPGSVNTAGVGTQGWVYAATFMDRALPQSSFGQTYTAMGKATKAGGQSSDPSATDPNEKVTPITPYTPTLNYIFNTPWLTPGEHPLVEIIKQLNTVA